MSALPPQRGQSTSPRGGEDDGPVRFVLEVDLDAGALAGPDRAAELGRILRYWGGSMKQVGLTAGARQELYDSGYAPVGEWRVEDS